MTDTQSSLDDEGCIESGVTRTVEVARNSFHWMVSFLRTHVDCHPLKQVSGEGDQENNVKSLGMFATARFQ